MATGANPGGTSSSAAAAFAGLRAVVIAYSTDFTPALTGAKEAFRSGTIVASERSNLVSEDGGHSSIRE